jgi:hypothetical protein
MVAESDAICGFTAADERWRGELLSGEEGDWVAGVAYVAPNADAGGYVSVVGGDQKAGGFEQRGLPVELVQGKESRRQRE